MSTKTNLDRKAAAKLLKVSIRTLDRYVKAGKLSTKTVDGRVWLDQNEIKDFAEGKRRHKGIVSTPDMSIDKEVDTAVDNSQVYQEPARVEVIETSEKEGIDIYEGLYLKTKEELEEKQERLELANYRVGQLEARIRDSIPLIEYKRETLEREKREKEVTEKLKETVGMMKKLSLDLRYQKSSKQIFVLLLIIVVVLQPLWLVFLGR